MGQSIQEWTKRNLWKTAFKKLTLINPNLGGGGGGGNFTPPVGFPLITQKR